MSDAESYRDNVDNSRTSPSKPASTLAPSSESPNMSLGNPCTAETVALESITDDSYPKIGATLVLANVYIGTAGYQYQHWRRGVFYPMGLSQSSELRHYSGVFPSVEINSTFHGLPREESLQTWVRNSKHGFCFSFKVPSIITHEKKLLGIADTWNVFLDRLQRCVMKGPSTLGSGSEGIKISSSDNYNNYNNSKLGPILFQLPPSLPKDVDRIHGVYKLLPTNRDEIRIAFEFRNPTWYCDEVYKALQQYNFALCENVSPDNSTYRTNVLTAHDWSYTRFHKRADDIITDYTNEQLAMEANNIVDRYQRGMGQYIYFLNDHEGNGPKNARTLTKIVLERVQEQQQQQQQQQQQSQVTTGFGGEKIKSLVHDWKPDLIVEKGGKGSIESMFASVAASTTSTATAASTGANTPTTSSSSMKKQTNPHHFSVSSEQSTLESFSGKRKVSSTSQKHGMDGWLQQSTTLSPPPSSNKVSKREDGFAKTKPTPSKKSTTSMNLTDEEKKKGTILNFFSKQK